MTRAISAALAALTLAALALAATGGYVVAHKRTDFAPAGSPAHDAAIALQASYNTQQLLLGVPLRIVGAVSCKQVAVISPRAVQVFCSFRLVGPHTQGVGGCAQLTGVFYRQLGQIAEGTTETVPCPDEQ